MTIQEFSRKVDKVLTKVPEEFNGINNPSYIEGIKIFQERMIKEFLEKEKITVYKEK